MYLLQQMIKMTALRLQEQERRERALRWILHVLLVAQKQGAKTKQTIILMLCYEEKRQKTLLGQRWLHHKISKKEKVGMEQCIQLYGRYVQLLLKQLEKY